MIEVRQADWPGTAEELTAAVEAFRAQLVAHRRTVGVAAPLPDHWLIERLAKSGDTFRLVPEVGMTDEDMAAYELEQARLAALRAIDDARLEEAARAPDAPDAVKAWADRREQARGRR